VSYMDLFTATFYAFNSHTNLFLFFFQNWPQKVLSEMFCYKLLGTYSSGFFNAGIIALGLCYLQAVDGLTAHQLPSQLAPDRAV